jgi:hypothetical protein
MSDNVVKFEPEVVGEGFRFDPDEILDKAKGQGFTSVVIIGELPDGETWVSSAANGGESLILIERAKLQIIGR